MEEKTGKIKGYIRVDNEHKLVKQLCYLGLTNRGNRGHRGKKDFGKSLVWSTFFSRSKSWTVENQNKTRLETAEM